MAEAFASSQPDGLRAGANADDDNLPEVEANKDDERRLREASRDDDSMPEEPDCQIGVQKLHIDLPTFPEFRREPLQDEKVVETVFAQQNHDRPSVLLNSIPLVKLDASNCDSKNPPTCGVCSGVHVVGIRVKWLHCGHMVCPECLDEWYERNVCCPTCSALIEDGAPLVPQSEEAVSKLDTKDDTSMQWSPFPPQVPPPKKVGEDGFTDLPPSPYVEATEEPDIEPESNFEVFSPNPAVESASPPKEPPPMLPIVVDEEVGDEEMGLVDATRTVHSEFANSSFGVETLTCYTSRMVKYPCRICLAYTAVILIVIVVGVINRPFNLQTDFSAFVQADGEAMLRRDAYILALKERTGKSQDDRRRLSENAEDSSTEESIRWVDRESGREDALSEDDIYFYDGTEDASDGFDVHADATSGDISAQNRTHPRRLQSFYFVKKTLTLMYVADGGNPLDSLGNIKAFENRLVNLPMWKKACDEMIVSSAQGMCNPGESLATYYSFTMSDPKLGDEAFRLKFDGSGSGLQGNMWLQYMKENANPVTSLLRYFPNGYDVGSLVGKSSFSPPPAIRSTFTLKFNVGAAGGNIANVAKARKKVVAYYKDFVADELYPYLSDCDQTCIGGVKMYFHGDEVISYEVNHTIMTDCMWAIGSFVFVILFIWFHTGSLLLSISSLGIIFVSVPVAYAFTPAKNTTVVYFLALFLITGVGSDVVFVFTDYWEQAQGLDKPVEVKFAWMMMQAGKSCLATSLTTSVSFFANLAMALQPLREFGLFMGLCVMCVFIFVLILLPPLLAFRNNRNLQRKQQRQNKVMDEALIDTQVSEKLALNDAATAEGLPNDGLVPEAKQEKKASKPCVRRLLLGTTDFVVRRPYKIVCFFGALVLIFFIGIIAKAEQDSGVPALFPDEHNQVQAEEWLGRFASIETLGAYTISEGDDGAACLANTTVSLNRKYTLNDQCLFHWCDTPGNLSTYGSPDMTSGYCWIGPNRLSEIQYSQGYGHAGYRIPWSSQLSPDMAKHFELSNPESEEECEQLDVSLRLATFDTPNYEVLGDAFKPLVEKAFDVSYSGVPSNFATTQVGSLVFEDWGTGSLEMSSFYHAGGFSFESNKLKSSDDQATTTTMGTTIVTTSEATTTTMGTTTFTTSEAQPQPEAEPALETIEPEPDTTTPTTTTAAQAYPCTTGTSGTACLTCEVLASRTTNDHCASCNPGHHLVGQFCQATMYWAGSPNTNQCPIGSVAIGPADACQDAAVANGWYWGGSETNSFWPKGCYLSEQGGARRVYYNLDSVGQSKSTARPICKNVEVVTKTCKSLALCYFGTPRCSFEGWRYLGEAKAGGRRLDDVEDVEESAASPRSSRRQLVSRQLKPVKLYQPGAYQGSELTTFSRQTDVTIVFGIRAAASVPLVGAIGKPWDYDSTFDIRNPWAQRAILKACWDVTPELLVLTTECWIEDFKNTLTRFPTRDFEAEINTWDASSGKGKLSVAQNLWRADGQTRGARISFYTNFDRLSAAAKGIEFNKKWQAYTDRMNSQASITANKGWATASTFVRAEAEDAIIQSTLWTIATATVCTWLCILVFTKDPIIACLVTALVLGIIAGLAFFMVVIKGWKIGATEVLALIVFMGYAVTYSLHIAHNFAKLGHHPNQEMIDLEKEWVLKETRRAERKAKKLVAKASGGENVYKQMQDKPMPSLSPSVVALREAGQAGDNQDILKRNLTKEETARAKVRMAMLQVGGATISSSISTMGCSFFLLFCTMNIFVKLGWVVIAVTVLSIVFALVALPATLLSFHCYCCSCCKPEEKDATDY